MNIAYSNNLIEQRKRPVGCSLLAMKQIIPGQVALLASK